MPKTCPECKGAKEIQADFPCRTCKGSGIIVMNKMPAACPALCDKGAVKGTERCPTCRGRGSVPD